MSEPQYEAIDGWRITPHELGPHPQGESCDEEPACGHVYRLREGAESGSPRNLDSVPSNPSSSGADIASRREGSGG